MKITTIAPMSVAGLLTAGLIAYATPAVGAAGDTDLAGNRKDDNPDVVMTVDDDDEGRDDTNTGTGGATNNSGVDNTNSGTGNSNDGTNSRMSAVSRDGEVSRGDKTKDWTRDGGDRTRDFSQNRTNDKSRNDTRR